MKNTHYIKRGLYEEAEMEAKKSNRSRDFNGQVQTRPCIWPRNGRLMKPDLAEYFNTAIWACLSGRHFTALQLVLKM